MSRKSIRNFRSGNYKHRVPDATTYYITLDNQQLYEIIDKGKEASTASRVVSRDKELLSLEIETRHAICCPKDASMREFAGFVGRNCVVSGFGRAFSKSLQGVELSEDSALGRALARWNLVHSGECSVAEIEDLDAAKFHEAQSGSRSVVT
ncbi:hypothetical protein [Agrobacterium sp. CFBP2214]|uniref:hypothetical protein n=1 Tax=Agrobacterium sp. CFBP2214 TaxID=3040274 RepID=UPI001019EF12|nr:hypothetical protein [Agrobacterium sp. CFBP2214]